MAIVRRFGPPDLFLTMTCNPEWKEVQDALRYQYKGMTLQQLCNYRPDIIIRVFERKAKMLIDDIMNKQIFGKALAYVAVIEFQKRGLPHLHLLVTLAKEDKLRNPEDVDAYVWAEIPDLEEDPELYELVKKFMVHGPCGQHNPKAYCMIDGKCRFRFKKE